MTTTLREDDRYRVKASIHAVLDSILDAKETLPDSPYSCSTPQLKLHTQLNEAHNLMLHALYLTNQVD